jgi:hypothetical protein
MDSFEGESDSAFNLIVRDNYPVDVASASVPVSPRVFVVSVSLLETRSDERRISEQMTDTAGVGVFAAGAIMTARHLNRLPSRKLSQ